MAKFLVLLLSLVIISIVLIEYSEAKHSKHHSNQEKHKHPRHKHSPQSKESHKGHQDEINDDDAGWEYENTTKVDTRRILFSKQSKKGARPYMVYLQLTKESAKAHKYRGWLCGGVIVDRYYVLTSAACVEDADHFYVVSGTMKFVDSFDYKNNPCVCNNRRKVVWKCIPKNYKFDFQDSIKWSSNDIAIVKVNKPFKLGVCEKGCDFATDLICYNNISRDLERPGTKGIILGWGSGSNFREGVYRRQRPYLATNAKCLQEAKVCIMDNEQCAKKWSQRFRNIITQYMICTKDVMKRLSEICDKKYANCTDMEETRRVNAESTDLAPPQDEQIDLGRHLRDPFDYVARRSTQGGFCENDHGGPLIVKYQNKDRVIGVISACKIDPKSHSCHGPFLYTSVFKNRQFISCSIYKDVEESCRRVFRSGITHEEVSVNWDGVDEDTHNDENRDDNEEKANSGSEKSDDDDDESNEVLRAKEEKKESKSPKKDASSSSDSSSSSSSGESLAMQKSGHDSEKKSDKTKKRNAKKRSGDKKQSSKKKETRKSNYGEARKRSDDRKEVFYESSRDENVNDPEEDE